MASPCSPAVEQSFEQFQKSVNAILANLRIISLTLSHEVYAMSVLPKMIRDFEATMAHLKSTMECFIEAGSKI